MSRKNRDMPLRGDRLKAKRIEIGYSQEAFAEAVKSTRRQISRYEHGKSEPRADTLARIASELGCSADWLLGLTDKQTGYGPEVDPKSLALAIRLMKLGNQKRRVIIGALDSLEQLP